MKAKEYAEFYKENPTPERLKGIIKDFMAQLVPLAEQRHAQTTAAFCAILNELDDKWRAFVRLVGDENIRPDGFERLIEKTGPTQYQVWVDYRKQTKRR